MNIKRMIKVSLLVFLFGFFLTGCSSSSGNKAPYAHDQSITLNENTTKKIVLSGIDLDGDTLTYKITSAPKHGVYQGNMYVPNRNFHGQDSFSFIANDGKKDSESATVSITIKEINKPSTNVKPVVASLDVTMAKNSNRKIFMVGTDENGDVLSFKVVNSPSHGTYVNSVYTPDTNYSGTDSFTYSANDGQLDSDVATVNITISGSGDQSFNVAPVATGQAITMQEDSSKIITLVGTDSDGDSLTYHVIAGPSHGTYTGTTYTPDANYFGVDSFTFKANDGTVDSSPATVTITITDVAEPTTNVAPVAVGQSITVLEDTSQDILLTATDSNGDSLTYHVITSPLHGIYTGTTYTPDANYFGTDSFTFKANDGQLDSNLATVNITITNTGERPVAIAQSVSVQENDSVDIVLAGTDADSANDELTFVVVVAPSHGTFDGTTYTPEADYFGADSFTFTASDGVLTSVAATISITVEKVNTQPVANGQSTVRLQKNLNKKVPMWGFDADGDDLSFIIVNQPSHGKLTGVESDFIYHPEKDFFGDDSFTFKVNDGEVDSGAITINLKVSNLVVIKKSRDVNADGQIDNIVTYITNILNGRAFVKAYYDDDADSSTANFLAATNVYSLIFPELLLSRVQYNNDELRTSQYLYYYNPQQQLIKWKQDVNGNGIFTYFVRYTYDTNGNEISRAYDYNDDASDGINSHTTTTYDSSGRKLVSTRYDSNNVIKNISTWSYTGLTHLLTIDEDANGSTDKIIKFIYDIHGNLLTREKDDLNDDSNDFVINRAYNADGNIISRSSSTGSGGTYSYGTSGIASESNVDVLLSQDATTFYVYGVRIY